MLPALVCNTLLAFAAALALWVTHPELRAAAAHLVFAAGILPLILGATTHFVPVLTRGTGPARAVAWLPWIAAAAGTGAAAAMGIPAFHPYGIIGGAAAGLLAASGMLGWIVLRARRALGAPHPCLAWYLAACVFLALALVAALWLPFAGPQRAALRIFHLHANTLGFVGLTAIGTLQVLMPTAAGRPDPQAAARLKRDLPLAGAGVALVAVGAAWMQPLAALGVIALLVPVARLARAWMKDFRVEICARDGAPPALALALGGFALLLLSGLDHAARAGTGAWAPATFFIAFLLPLVTGAVSQLLPVWLRPGPQTEWHAALRAALGRHARARSGCFIGAGVLAWFGSVAGFALAGAALALFAGQLILALTASGRTARHDRD
ncbi:MAG: hypothetical protein COZ38_00335 [Rhodocyclales bacterium CG_4_10_14_3_um_filter_68_10]|nr:MAG: hypothetical protein COZ38_00335 [Rhodocyclales bacterium CG_4_10_14_3_um_filter_68_10]